MKNRNMVYIFPIILTIGVFGFCNADTTDLHSAGSLERKLEEKVMSWTRQSTCGPVNYKSGIYKRWAPDDPIKPTSTGKCSGQCRQAGPNKCKGFVFYYKKKTCLLLNYEAEKSKFLPHVSAACGYWAQSGPTLSPTPQSSCKAKIQLKFAKHANDIPTFGTHNDYLIVTKKSKQNTFESCCYMQQNQSYCKHDGGDAVFENFADEYYDYIDSEEVVIQKANGGEFLLEAKHYFNDFEAVYYGKGYADHTVPAQMIVSVNDKFLKKISHAKNKGKNTHINLEYRQPDINPEYLGYVKAMLKCDSDCQCKVIVWRRTKRPGDGPCDNFEDDDKDLNGNKLQQ